LISITIIMVIIVIIISSWLSETNNTLTLAVCISRIKPTDLVW